MQKSEVAQLVATLLAAYPSAVIAKNTSAVYEEMLADLDYELAQQAVKRVICRCRFFPTVAEIRSAADGVENESPRVYTPKIRLSPPRENSG